MLLWDIIRDWFVQYVWGGTLSNGDIVNVNGGSFYWLNDGTMDTDKIFFNDFLIKTNFYDYSADSSDFYYSLSDWLSTTSTVIVMILLCVVFGLMVRWLFRLTSGLLQGR